MSGSRRTLISDMILIGCFVLCAFVVYVIQTSDKNTGHFAEVCVNGKSTERFSLETDGVYILNNGTNVIEIKDGCVLMIKADCPDGLCIKQGKIKYSGQCITCLPNRLTVTVADDSSHVDFVL